MNKIVLITTEGCEGCNIAISNIHKALQKTTKNISINIRDKSYFTKDYLRSLKITDFPAILLFKDETLKVKYIGSVPAIVILRWIDIHFT